MIIRNIFFILFMIVASSVEAQTVNMGDSDYPESSPADCDVFGTAGQNFADPGGEAADYPSNYNGTMVFCPDLTTGTKMSIQFRQIGNY